MIAPDVRIEDLDPEGFAWLCGLAAQRQHRPQRWLWILHRGGSLLGCRPTEAREGLELESLDLGSPQIADTLIGRSDYERVVIVDGARTQDLADALDREGDTGRDQADYFRACQEAFWSSAAVSTAPAPPRTSTTWPRLSEALSARELTASCVVVEGSDLLLSLHAHFHLGQLSALTSLHDLSPSWRSWDELATSSSALRASDVVVVTDRQHVEEAFSAADLLGTFIESARNGSAHFARGLERLP